MYSIHMVGEFLRMPPIPLLSDRGPLDHTTRSEVNFAGGGGDEAGNSHSKN